MYRNSSVKPACRSPCKAAPSEDYSVLLWAKELDGHAPGMSVTIWLWQLNALQMVELQNLKAKQVAGDKIPKQNFTWIRKSQSKLLREAKPLLHTTWAGIMQQGVGLQDNGYHHHLWSTVLNTWELHCPPERYKGGNWSSNYQEAQKALARIS